MTFEEFRDTAVWCDDLGAKLADACWADEPAKARGWIYVDALFIEEVLPHWPEKTRKAGKWYLLIGRCEWISDDLEELERHLYEYACDEGYCDE